VIDPFQIALVVIAVFSALFGAIMEGFRLTLGYRGSEETRIRKERIDSKLRSEVETEMNRFLESDECKKGSEKRIQIIEELGYKGYIAEFLTSNILNKSHSLMKACIKQLPTSFLMLFLTVLIAVYSDITQLVFFIIFAIYLATTVLYFWSTVKSLRKTYFLREKFIELEENSALEYAMNLHEELVNGKLL
jgi:hypothetical protein